MDEVPAHIATRHRPIGLAAALLASFGFILFACGGQWNVPEPAKEVKNPVPSSAEVLTDARRIYGNTCAHCHGVSGDGKRPAGSSYFYWTQPTNFTDTKTMDAMTDGEIFWKISTGNRPMPSYEERLTDKERWELVDLLRTFAHPQGKPAPPNPPPAR